MAHRVLKADLAGLIPPGHCAFAVMTKAPVPGKVKTRLTPPLTPMEAAELNVCFLRDTARGIENAVSQSAARGIAVYTPVGSESAYEGILPSSFDLVPQRGDAFGERLQLAMHDLFRLGFASVCLIDSDSPIVPHQAFSEAATVLAESENTIVLGPSEDGGYYLVGSTAVHPSLFEDIDWSTERVLEQTLERAKAAGLGVHLLPASYDVDDQRTLSRLCADLLGAGSDISRDRAPATAEYLAELVRKNGQPRIWPNDLSI